MKHNEENKLGMNRTGTMMSPMEAAKTAKGAVEYTRPSSYEFTISDNRVTYMKEADPQGTMPIPATVRGMVNGINDKIQNGGYTFMDKLGERLAFERTGVRLYDALISKHMGTEDKTALPSLTMLEKIREDELQHFRMLVEAMTAIGGDPTAITPCANIAAVASMGWMQVLTDPRTTFEQCVGIILQTELVDNDGWDLLITLAQNLGQTELAEKFTRASEQEAIHLSHVRDWMEQFSTTGEAGVDVQASPQ